MRVYACMSAPVSACKPARFVCMRACVHTRKTRVYVHVLTPMDASFPATIMLTHPDEHYSVKTHRCWPSQHACYATHSSPLRCTINLTGKRQTGFVTVDPDLTVRHCDGHSRDQRGWRADFICTLSLVSMSKDSPCHYLISKWIPTGVSELRSCAESRGWPPGLPGPNSLYGLCGRKATLKSNS